MTATVVVADAVLGAPTPGDAVVIEDGRVVAVTWRDQVGTDPTYRHDGAVILPGLIEQRSDGIWIYRPASHKTKYKGKVRLIVLGPQAQKVLRPYLNRDPDAFCFSPEEAMAQRRAALRTTKSDDVLVALHPRLPPSKPPDGCLATTPTATRRRS